MLLITKNNKQQLFGDFLVISIHFDLEEDLPCFGSLVSDQNQQLRRKSQNIQGKSEFSVAYLSTNSSTSKDVSQTKSACDFNHNANGLHSKAKYSSKLNPDLGYGEGKSIISISQSKGKSKQEPKQKQKKLSI